MNHSEQITTLFFCFRLGFSSHEERVAEVCSLVIAANHLLELMNE